MQLPYDENYKIDEGELRRFSARLAAIEGIAGLVPNGHTGEVFALTPAERAEVTRIVAGEVGGRPRGSSRKRLGTPRDRSMPLEDYSDSRSTRRQAIGAGARNSPAGPVRGTHHAASLEDGAPGCPCAESTALHPISPGEVVRNAD